MSCGKWRPFCLGLNVLKSNFTTNVQAIILYQHPITIWGVVYAEFENYAFKITATSPKGQCIYALHIDNGFAFRIWQCTQLLYENSDDIWSPEGSYDSSKRINVSIVI